MNGGYYAASPDPSFLITGFPSPLEVTGVSYSVSGVTLSLSQFPSPIEETGGYYIED